MSEHQNRSARRPHLLTSNTTLQISYRAESRKSARQNFGTWTDHWNILQQSLYLLLHLYAGRWDLHTLRADAWWDDSHTCGRARLLVWHSHLLLLDSVLWGPCSPCWGLGLCLLLLRGCSPIMCLLWCTHLDLYKVKSAVRLWCQIHYWRLDVGCQPRDVSDQ